MLTRRDNGAPAQDLLNRALQDDSLEHGYVSGLLQHPFPFY